MAGSPWLGYCFGWGFVCDDFRVDYVVVKRGRSALFEGAMIRQRRPPTNGPMANLRGITFPYIRPRRHQPGRASDLLGGSGPPHAGNSTSVLNKRPGECQTPPLSDPLRAGDKPFQRSGACCEPDSHQALPLEKDRKRGRLNQFQRQRGAEKSRRLILNFLPYPSPSPERPRFWLA